MENKPLISAAIITFNEEANLGRTLKSIKNFTSEIIIIDSGSNDKTREIALNFGAKVYIEEWKGFAEQKNSLIPKCNFDWILFLDADEEITDTLKYSIIEKIETENFVNGFFIKRKTFYLGKLLKHSWQPDSKLRLVRKNANPIWVGNEIHEKLHIDGKTAELDGFLIHYSYKNISHHFQKTLHYSVISARDYYQKGKKFSFLKLLFNPAIAFIRMYILNLSMLDGLRGFIAAFSSAFYTAMKYIHLWELASNQNKD